MAQGLLLHLLQHVGGVGFGGGLAVRSPVSRAPKSATFSRIGNLRYIVSNGALNGPDTRRFVFTEAAASKLRLPHWEFPQKCLLKILTYLTSRVRSNLGYYNLDSFIISLSIWISFRMKSILNARLIRSRARALKLVPIIRQTRRVNSSTFSSSTLSKT